MKYVSYLYFMYVHTHKYEQAVAPDKKIFSTDWGVSVAEAMRMRHWAFERGLYFVPWSFQIEDQYIPLQFEGDADKELAVIFTIYYII